MSKKAKISKAGEEGLMKAATGIFLFALELQEKPKLLEEVKAEQEETLAKGSSKGS